MGWLSVEGGLAREVGVGVSNNARGGGAKEKKSWKLVVVGGGWEEVEGGKSRVGEEEEGGGREGQRGWTAFDLLCSFISFFTCFTFLAFHLLYIDLKSF